MKGDRESVKCMRSFKQATDAIKVTTIAQAKPERCFGVVVAGGIGHIVEDRERLRSRISWERGFTLICVKECSPSGCCERDYR